MKFDIRRKIMAALYGDVPIELQVEALATPNLKTALYEGANFAQILATQADSIANTKNGLIVSNWEYLFNGVTWDRKRGNVEAGLMGSAARTANGSSSDVINFNYRGTIINIDVSAVSGTNPTLDVVVQIKDETSSTYLTVASLPQIVGVDFQSIIVYPSVIETVAITDLLVQGIPLTRKWRISFTIGGTDTPTFTFSVNVTNLV